LSVCMYLNFHGTNTRLYAAILLLGVFQYWSGLFYV
jgi:hypothetical protein